MGLLRQFLRFSTVGVAGFVVDAAVLVAVMAAGIAGPYAGRVVSFLCAATSTWLLNRVYTFRESAGSGDAAQWARFLGVNAIGAFANLGVYVWLIAILPHLPGQPVTAVAAGSLSALAINFTLSRTLVFAAGRPTR